MAPLKLIVLAGLPGSGKEHAGGPEHGHANAKVSRDGGSAFIFVRQSVARWFGFMRTRGRADPDAIAM